MRFFQVLVRFCRPENDISQSISGSFAVAFRFSIKHITGIEYYIIYVERMAYVTGCVCAQQHACNMFVLSRTGLG